MWLPVSLGMKLNQPLAVLLERIFVDIAFHRTHSGVEGCDLSLYADVFRDVSSAFECFSILPEPAICSQNVRQAPVCFKPMVYSPTALYEASDRSVDFANKIGRLLEERLGVSYTASVSATESNGGGFAMQIEELIAQTDELLRSGDLSMVVFIHRMLLRAQGLCALLAGFGQLRALAHSVLSTAAPVLTEPPLR